MADDDAARARAAFLQGKGKPEKVGPQRRKPVPTQQIAAMAGSKSQLSTMRNELGLKSAQTMNASYFLARTDGQENFFAKEAVEVSHDAKSSVTMYTTNGKFANSGLQDIFKSIANAKASSVKVK